MPNDQADAIEKVQKVFEQIIKYRGLLSPGAGDTNADVRNWSFNVGKQDKEFIINAEVDLTLTPKTTKQADLQK